MARTQRAWAFGTCGVLFAGALWAGSLGACGSDSKSSDDDAGTSEDDGGTREDAGNKDAGANDAGAKDAGAKDAGGDAGEEADAGPSDPAVPGNDPPTISKVGYYNDSLGPRVLVQGRDPNGDVASYTMRFLKDGGAVSLDLDGDPTMSSASSEFTDDLSSSAGEAGFFARFDPSIEMLEAVDQVIVTVKDAMNNVSAELMSNKVGAAPATSGSCDPLGFNLCAGTNVCAPTSATTYGCRSLSSVRTAACTTAPLLEPPGTATVQGRVSSPSRWEPREGCLGGVASREPDAVVKLRLAAAATVVLRMVPENTEFDSVLYKLGTTPQMCTMDTPMCPAMGSCDCEDGDGTPSGLRNAVLRLVNLPAGDHYIAIDSSPQPENIGTRFEITATIE